MFFKLLWYDLKIGVFRQYKKLLITVAIFAAASIEHWMKVRVYVPEDPALALEDTLGNTLLSVFQGMQEYSPTLDRQFTFPAVWMLMYLVLAYFTLHYPYNDLEESGQNLLIRSRGRRLWWISKCIWNMVTVILFFVTGWGVVLVSCLIRGIPITMEISGNIAYFLELRFSQFWLYPDHLTLEILVMPMLVMAACCLLQMTLSLFIRPVFSFMVTGAVLLASAYYQSPFLIGNYAMPIRSSRLMMHGIDPVYGIFFSIGVMALAFVTGLVRFKKYDILRRE